MMPSGRSWMRALAACRTHETAQQLFGTGRSLQLIGPQNKGSYADGSTPIAAQEMLGSQRVQSGQSTQMQLEPAPTMIVGARDQSTEMEQIIDAINDLRTQLEVHR
eukprot:4015694-Amphidinium_carterae.1